MASPLYTVSEYWAGSDFGLLARIEALSGSNITISSTSSIAYRVFPLSNPSNVSIGTLVVADVVFNTLQTDYNWPTDVYPAGYNFRWLVPNSLVPNPDEQYVFELRFSDQSTPAKVLPLVHVRKTRSLTSVVAAAA